MLQYYAQERQLAAEHGLQWRERGPRNSDGTSDVPSFRGQAWRPGAKRYANRGGKARVYHSEYRRSLGLGFSEADARRRAQEAQDIVNRAEQEQ